MLKDNIYDALYLILFYLCVTCSTFELHVEPHQLQCASDMNRSIVYYTGKESCRIFVDTVVHLWVAPFNLEASELPFHIGCMVV